MFINCNIYYFELEEDKEGFYYCSEYNEFWL